MGNSNMGSVTPSRVPIRKFYSSSAWIEGRAEDHTLKGEKCTSHVMLLLLGLRTAKSYRRASRLH